MSAQVVQVQQRHTVASCARDGALDGPPLAQPTARPPHIVK